MSVGWSSRERRDCSLVARCSLSGSSEGKQLPWERDLGAKPSDRLLEAVTSPPGQTHSTCRRWVGQAQVQPGSPLLNESTVTTQVQIESVHLVLDQQGTWWGTAAGELRLGTVGAPRWRRGEPLLEAELPGGSLHWDSFQRFPYSSSCLLAGSSQPSSYKGSVLGTLALQLSQRAFLAFLQGLVSSPVRFLSVSDATAIHVPFWGFCFVICTIILGRQKRRWLH